MKLTGGINDGNTHAVIDQIIPGFIRWRLGKHAIQITCEFKNIFQLSRNTDEIWIKVSNVLG